jgi:hypothetical protein
MKKLSIIIVLASLIFSSCDDFLDIKPVGKVIPTTYKDFRGFLTNAYETVPKDRALSSVRGDELKLKYSAWSDDYKSYESNFIWNDIDPDINTIDFPWQQFYKSILNANHVILEGVAATEGTKDEIDQLVGEAYLLRAYLHFGLANLYADIYSADNLEKKAIPLATTIDIWKNYTPNTIAEVYKQITDDIEAGIALLNIDEQPKGFNYRFSKVSAYGFAARVYLYMGEWDTAKDYAKKAYDINNTLIDLNTDDAQLPVEFNSVENILALEQTFDSNFKWTFYVSKKLTDSFDKDNDKRFAKYFEADGEDYKSLLGKELKNKVSMRTSEFYLMLAETEAKSTDGNLTTAKQYLKDLIAKRLAPDYYTTEATAIDAMDKAAFTKRVEEERFRELACQGFRWFDLRRNGKPELVKEFNGETYTLNQGDNRYVIRFPREAVANNPNLKQ